MTNESTSQYAPHIEATGYSSLIERSPELFTNASSYEQETERAPMTPAERISLVQSSTLRVLGGVATKS